MRITLAIAAYASKTADPSRRKPSHFVGAGLIAALSRLGPVMKGTRVYVGGHRGMVGSAVWRAMTAPGAETCDWCRTNT